MSSSSPTTLTDFRMVLLGKTGVGKSASGNTILGANVFPSEQSSSSITTACQKHSSAVAGRTVTLVDTPDFFYATQSEDLSSEIKRSVDLAIPGVHAFLYVVALTTFTEQEIDVVRLFLEQCFGEAAPGYTVIIFTYGDQLDGVSVETVIDQNTFLSAVIEACGGRYCVFNNKLPPGSSAANDQVMWLLQVVDGLMRSKNGRCYTVEMLEEAQRRAEERLQQIREEEHREEEEKQRKHQENIQRAIQETEERVRREENERWERENQEMQVEQEKRRKESWDWSKLKYILGAFITVAMGGFQGAFLVEPQHADRYKVFVHGWAMGAASMIRGRSAVEVWMFVRKRMLNRTSHRDRWFGVMCGFTAGALTGHLMGRYEVPRFEVGGTYRLLTGAVGAYGAYICYRS